MKTQFLEKQQLLKQWLLNRNCPRHPWEKLTELENGDIECMSCIAEGAEPICPNCGLDSCTCEKGGEKENG